VLNRLQRPGARIYSHYTTVPQRLCKGQGRSAAASRATDFAASPAVCDRDHRRDRLEAHREVPQVFRQAGRADVVGRAVAVPVCLRRRAREDALALVEANRVCRETALRCCLLDVHGTRARAVAGRALAEAHRLAATPAQTASITPKGHVPVRNPYTDDATQAPGGQSAEDRQTDHLHLPCRNMLTSELLEALAYAHRQPRFGGPLDRYDLIIIGGGAAAFAAATKANDLGATALMVNSGLPLGGTFVNVGCVPSKHLLGIAEALMATRRSAFDSVPLARLNGQFSVRAARNEKDAFVEGLRRRNYEQVLESLEHVDLREGRGRHVAPGRVEVDGESFEGRHVLVATGARASIPPIPGLAEAGYLTNVEALQVDEAPARLVVIGGGPLGLEFAQIFARFGSQVTVLEALPQIVPKAEPEIAAALRQALEEEGIDIRTGMRIERVQPGPPKTVECGPRTNDRFDADAILVATGIRALRGPRACNSRRPPEPGGVCRDDGLVPGRGETLGSGGRGRPHAA